MLGVYLDVLHRSGQRLGAGGTGTRGPWNETPVPVMPTELLGQGGITVHAVQANGDGALAFAPDEPAADAGQALDDLNIYPDVRSRILMTGKSRGGGVSNRRRIR